MFSSKNINFMSSILFFFLLNQQPRRVEASSNDPTRNMPSRIGASMARPSGAGSSSAPPRAPSSYVHSSAAALHSANSTAQQWIGSSTQQILANVPHRTAQSSVQMPPPSMVPPPSVVPPSPQTSSTSSAQFSHEIRNAFDSIDTSDDEAPLLPQQTLRSTQMVAPSATRLSLVPPPSSVVPPPSSLVPPPSSMMPPSPQTPSTLWSRSRFSQEIQNALLTLDTNIIDDADSQQPATGPSSLVGRSSSSGSRRNGQSSSSGSGGSGPTRMTDEVRAQIRAQIDGAIPLTSIVNSLSTIPHNTVRDEVRRQTANKNTEHTEHGRWTNDDWRKAYGLLGDEMSIPQISKQTGIPQSTLRGRFSKRGGAIIRENPEPREQRSWTEEDWRKANELQNKMSVAQISTATGIPKSTLRSHFKKLGSSNIIGSSSHRQNAPSASVQMTQQMPSASLAQQPAYGQYGQSAAQQLPSSHLARVDPSQNYNQPAGASISSQFVAPSSALHSVHQSAQMGPPPPPSMVPPSPPLTSSAQFSHEIRNAFDSIDTSDDVAQMIAPSATRLSAQRFPPTTLENVNEGSTSHQTVAGNPDHKKGTPWSEELWDKAREMFSDNISVPKISTETHIPQSTLRLRLGKKATANADPITRNRSKDVPWDTAKELFDKNVSIKDISRITKIPESSLRNRFSRKAANSSQMPPPSSSRRSARQSTQMPPPPMVPQTPQTPSIHMTLSQINSAMQRLDELEEIDSSHLPNQTGGSSHRQNAPSTSVQMTQQMPSSSLAQQPAYGQYGQSAAQQLQSSHLARVDPSQIYNQHPGASSSLFVPPSASLIQNAPTQMPSQAYYQQPSASNLQHMTSSAANPSVRVYPTVAITSRTPSTVFSGGGLVAPSSHQSTQMFSPSLEPQTPQTPSIHMTLSQINSTMQSFDELEEINSSHLPNQTGGSSRRQNAPSTSVQMTQQMPSASLAQQPAYGQYGQSVAQQLQSSHLARVDPSQNYNQQPGASSSLFVPPSASRFQNAPTQMPSQTFYQPPSVSRHAHYSPSASAHQPTIVSAPSSSRASPSGRTAPSESFYFQQQNNRGDDATHMDES